MNEINVSVKKLYEDAILPTRGSHAAAGWDLYAYIPEGSIEINPLITMKVGTGIAIAAPYGWEASIYARSGLATNKNLAPINAVGIIDSDYRGELIVALHNHGNRAQIIKHGDRIAQLLFSPVPEVNWIQTTELEDTDRGAGGFGSTGE